MPLPTTRRPKQKLLAGLRRLTRNPKPISPYPVAAVTTEPESGGVATGQVRPPAAEIKKTVYNDNWFDRLAIHHLSQSVQVTTGSDL